MTKLATDLIEHRYKRYRFPAEITAHAVWLYYRFPLSLRDVEDLLAERGIDVSFQTVSEWAVKFGRKFADQLRRRSRGKFADKWHLDEMVVSIKGKKYWLWRAVDANGYVLDALLQNRRNKKAALRLMRKLLKSQGLTPRVMVDDKLRSYSAAKTELIPGIEHRSHKGLNNRAENSHLAMGLVVDRVSDILTIAENLLQPVPEISMSHGMRYADGIIAQLDSMICFLNLERMFEKVEKMQMAAA